MAYVGQQPVVGRYILLDQISGGFNGTATGFTMTAGGQGVIPGLAQNVLLSLGGVIQQPGVDYLVSGSGLTFTTAPVSGTTFFATVLGDAQAVGTPSDGTVIPASIASSGTFVFPSVRVSGVTTIASGTAVAPSLSISGDGSTGFYSPAAGQISITTSGTERFRIDNSGQLEAVSLGSAAAPAFSFTTDPNTGIYSPGADQLAISTNGTGRLFVDSTGRVGIGSTPSSLFHVSGNGVVQVTRSSQDLFINANYDAANTHAALQTSAGMGFALYTNGANERLRITSAGLVGIGYSSPSYTIDVNGTARFNGNTVINGSSLDINPGSGQPNITLRTGNTFRGYIEGNASGGLTFGSGPSATTAMTIDSSQRVGIGVSAPGTLLDLSSASTATDLRLNNTSTGGRAWQLLSNGAGGSGGAGNFSIFDGTHRLVIDSSGRLGIGTTSPGYLLDLSASTPVLNIASSATSGDGAQIRFVQNNGRVGRLYLTSESGTGAGAMTLENPDGRDIIFRHVSNERARIDSSGRLLVGTSSARSNFFNAAVPAGGIQVESAATGRISSFISSESSQYGAVLVLGKQRSGSVGGNTIVNSGDEVGLLSFQGSDGSEFVEAANIRVEVDGTPGANDMPGRLVFSTTADGASSPTERMRINNAGQIQINGAYAAGSNRISLGPTTSNFSRDTTSFASHIYFENPNGTVGQISTNGSATSFTTSSDYRLKENVEPITNGITRLQQLKPSRFNFIVDPGKTVDGFIAHEVQAVVPEAITGTKDEVDADGNPIYQGIDQSKLVPLLTAALQEAVARIEQLETAVATLQGS